MDNGGVIYMAQYIKIKDIRGRLNKWLIEEETQNTYKISCKGFISEINKKNTYIDFKDFNNDILCTSDIRNAYNGFPDRTYSKASFCEIKIKR